MPRTRIETGKQKKVMFKFIKKIFLFDKHTCPWWLAYSWDHRLRILLHDPESFIKPLLKPGDRAVDLGCGMGYFSIALARYAGANGTVYAVDIQEKMLAILKKRTDKLNLPGRIIPVLAVDENISVQGPVDFMLSFWMLHEVEDKEKFLRTWLGILKKGGKILLVEPKIHVSQKQFDQEIKLGLEIGLKPIDSPRIGLSHSVLFVK